MGIGLLYLLVYIVPVVMVWDPVQGLMKGISSRSNVSSSSWTTSLAEKFKAHWRNGHLLGSPPFVSQRRLEAATYATLPLDNRWLPVFIVAATGLEASPP